MNIDATFTKEVVATLPKGCNVITFVEAAIDTCTVPGCGGAFQAAWIPAAPAQTDPAGIQGAPDLLSQFVAASSTAINVIERDFRGEEETVRAASEAACRAIELEMAHSALELSSSLWDGLEKEATLRGIRGGQAASVLAGGLAQWGMRRNPKGDVVGNEWPWVNPAASLPVYSLVGAFLDEWNRAIIYAKSDHGKFNRAHTTYARATAEVACALATLALTAQREHDDYAGVAAGERDRPARPWAEHTKTRENEQQLATWLHLVWKEAAGCMKEEQLKCWERVQYFYSFRIKRGIEARPTDAQLMSLSILAYKHHYMVRMHLDAEAARLSSLSSIDAVDMLRYNKDGLSMAGLAELHFGNESSEEGEKEAEGDQLKALDNQWRVCVARAEYDRSSLSPYPPDEETTLQQASRLYGRFPRAQGWAPVETKDARALGMGLYSRYICGNCAKWAPHAPVCPGCKSIRFCSTKCREEAMGGPTKVITNEGTSYVNFLCHAKYCDGKKVLAPEGKIPIGFVFPTAVNIYKVPVRDAVRMLAEHGMTNLNVLVHCTRRIDLGRDEVDAASAVVLLAACTNAAEAMRDRECMRYLHLLHWLPLFWTLFAPLSKRPCEAAARYMIRSPRKFAASSFELVVSWAPALLSAVSPSVKLTVTADGKCLRRSSNPTHNIPIYLMCTLRGMLRLTKDEDGFHTAFWDGMGRQLTNALIVVLLALENHECRLEHNLRSLPDVILRILYYLSNSVKVLPTFSQLHRCVEAIGRCGWSRLRSHLALGWVRSVRLGLSDRRTVSQSEWSALEAMVSQPSGAYYSNFQVPVTWDECMHKLKRPPCEAHTNPNNFVALEEDPPDTLAAYGDTDHEANQSEDEAGDTKPPNPPGCVPPLVRKVLNAPLLAGAHERRHAARKIQRAWHHLMRKRISARCLRAAARATAAGTRQRRARSPRPGQEPIFAGLADAPHRPNEWIDIATPCSDMGTQQTYANFKSSYFASALNTQLAARPRQALKLA